MNIITNIAAWWGAVVATFVIIWDIYKWKHSRSIINITASPNMTTFGEIPDHPRDKKYISVEVTNTGAQKTTITHLLSSHYKSLIFKLIKKTDKNYVVLTPAFLAPKLPHILEPGERWLGGIEQNDELEKLSRNGFLYCGICHSNSKKSVMQRVIIHKEN
jgi:hypothetical protein